MRVFGGNLAQHRIAAIIAAVIDEQDFVRLLKFVEDLLQLPMQRRQIVPLIVERNDY